MNHPNVLRKLSENFWRHKKTPRKLQETREYSRKLQELSRKLLENDNREREFIISEEIKPLGDSRKLHKNLIKLRSQFKILVFRKPQPYQCST